MSCHEEKVQFMNVVYSFTAIYIKVTLGMTGAFPYEKPIADWWA
jgi:hypothetical protein